MKGIVIRLAGILLLAGILSSCRVFNPSVMLRTKKHYPYAVAQDSVPNQYVIQKGDILTFRLYSNQGFKIIDLSTMDEGNRSAQQVNVQNVFPYLVDKDSMVNLPILGRVNLAGLNVIEAEEFLEEKYRDYYNEPFILLQVQNRRITVFPGQGGDAKVIPITNDYITIVEALALAGGISTGGKAHKIKVVRGKLNDPEVFEVDLSTAEGLAAANMHYVRANDIIYVQPSYFVGKQLVTTSAQVLALITNSITTYLILNNFIK